VSGAARYQRRYRERTKAGLCVLRVQVDIVAWTEALIYCGMLQPADYDDKAAIEAATARIIELLPELDRLNRLGRR
jgi:hypothetical protein